ncbi:MAG: phospholipase [Planctomycetaceae bacterium]|nr:phospholipase [Planctomycetaceae bacterium]
MGHQLHNYTLPLLCVIIAFTLCPHVAKATDAVPGKQVQQSTTIVTDGEKSSIPHWTYLPKSYNDNTKQAVPLLLFLHGAGESGDDLNQVLQWGPPKRIIEGNHYPLVIVSPQCPDRKIGWNGKQLVMLIDELVGKYNIDRRRIYCTGLSMGGAGTFRIMETAPRLLATAVPICGRGNIENARKMTHQSVRIYVGSEDGVLQTNQQITTAIKKAGGDVTLTVYDGVGHVCWPAVYEDPKFYQWLLTQKRGH